MTHFKRNLTKKIDFDALIKNYNLISKGYNKLSERPSLKDVQLYLHCRNLVIEYCEYLMGNPDKATKELHDLIQDLQIDYPNGICSNYFNIFSYIVYIINTEYISFTSTNIYYHYIRGLITSISFL